MSPGQISDAIASVDKTLSTLREGWTDATPEKKGKWMDKINTALDARLDLMALRDNLVTA